MYIKSSAKLRINCHINYIKSQFFNEKTTFIISLTYKKPTKTNKLANFIEPNH